MLTKYRYIELPADAVDICMSPAITGEAGQTGTVDRYRLAGTKRTYLRIPQALAGCYVGGCC